jgi:SAM-dependent methyltransferase
MHFDAAGYTRALRRNWGGVASEFARVSSGYFAPATDPFFAFALLEPGQQVLDVACGPGMSSRLAARRVAPSGRVLAVDLSPAMLRLARERRHPAGAAPVRYRTMNAEALQLQARSFDAVLCHLGLMLFARPEAAAAEMVRVLRPGGLLACLVLGSAADMPFTSMLTTILPAYAPEMRAGGGPGLGDFALPGRMDELFARMGLREIRSERLRGTFAVPSMRRYWEISTRAFGRIGPILRSLPRATRREVRHRLFEKLATYEKGGRLEIPYEFVMARGVKPVRR